MTHKLGPLPEPHCHAHSGCDGEWPDMFTDEQLRAYALAEVEKAAAKERAIWAERDDIHTESSRIYAKLAAAVHSGADSVTLGVLLRREVNERTARAQRG